MADFTKGPIHHTKKGGGIVLLHKKEYRATRIQSSKPFKTIEYAAWETTIKNRRIIVIGIYHPLISTRSNTHINFLEEVSQLVQYFITNHQNLVLLGDFNIQTQKLQNLDTLEYNNTMEALGLKQHIIEPMHKLGNTLDLIYTESIEAIEVLHAFMDNYISDHRIVGIELQLKKHEKLESSRHRNFKAFNLKTFTKEFNNDRILQQTSLENAYNEFTQELTTTLHKIAPMGKNQKEEIDHGTLMNYYNKEK